MDDTQMAQEWCNDHKSFQGRQSLMLLLLLQGRRNVKNLGGEGDNSSVYIYIYIAGMIFPSPWNRVNIYKGISLEEMLLCKSELLAKSCESLNFLRQVYQKQLECHLMLFCIDRTALACYDYIQIFCFL